MIFGVLTMASEVEQCREFLQLPSLVSRVRQLRVWVPQLVEERMDHGVDSAQPLGRSVLKELGDEIYRIRICLAENLIERVRLDLRELVLHVVRVHRLDLLARRRPKHLDDLDQLVDTTLSWEERLPEHQLRHNASGGPDV